MATLSTGPENSVLGHDVSYIVRMIHIISGLIGHVSNIPPNLYLTRTKIYKC